MFTLLKNYQTKIYKGFDESEKNNASCDPSVYITIDKLNITKIDFDPSTSGILLQEANQNVKFVTNTIEMKI
jgi:hypothetical protein